MKKNLLLLGLIVFNLYGQTPIYRFTFNQTLSNTTNQHTFTGTGTTSVPDRFGVANAAMRTNGTNFPTVNLPLLPQGGATRSVSVWIGFQNGNTTDHVHLLQYGTASGSQLFSLQQLNDLIRLDGFGNGTSSAALPRYRYRNFGNNWYHYVFTYEGTNVKIYRNGNLVANTNLFSALNTIGTTLQLGSASSIWNTTNRNIAYDDLEIYDSVLTEAQIRAMYSAQSPLNTNGLVAYFPFNGSLNSHDNTHAFTNFSNNFPGGTFNTGYNEQGLSFAAGQGFVNNTLWSNLNNNNITICFWLRRSIHPLVSQSRYETPVEGFGSFGYSERDWTMREDFVSFYRTSSSLFRRSIPYDKDLNQWYHVAIQFINVGTDRYLLYYLNGEFVMAELGFPNSTIHRFHSLFSIGTGTFSNFVGNPDENKDFIGDLDELFIFNRQLSLPEIMAIRYQTLTPLSIDDVSVRQNMLLFPNPAKNILNIHLPNNSNIKTTKVLDILGKSLLTKNTNQINVSELNNGTYFIQVETTDGNIFREKFIKN